MRLAFCCTSYGVYFMGDLRARPAHSPLFKLRLSDFYVRHFSFHCESAAPTSHIPDSDSSLWSQAHIHLPAQAPMSHRQQIQMIDTCSIHWPAQIPMSQMSQNQMPDIKDKCKSYIHWPAQVPVSRTYQNQTTNTKDKLQGVENSSFGRTQGEQALSPTYHI